MTQEGKTNKEKEDFKTNFSGYLHCAPGSSSTSGTFLHISLHVLSERERYPQYSEIVDALSTLLIRSLALIFAQNFSS